MSVYDSLPTSVAFLFTFISSPNPRPQTTTGVLRSVVPETVNFSVVLVNSV